jgi:hypothetical protein
MRNIHTATFPEISKSKSKWSGARSETLGDGSHISLFVEVFVPFEPRFYAEGQEVVKPSGSDTIP